MPAFHQTSPEPASKSEGATSAEKSSSLPSGLPALNRVGVFACPVPTTAVQAARSLSDRQAAPPPKVVCAVGVFSNEEADELDLLDSVARTLKPPTPAEDSDPRHVDVFARRLAEEVLGLRGGCGKGCSTAKMAGKGCEELHLGCHLLLVPFGHPPDADFVLGSAG